MSARWLRAWWRWPPACGHTGHHRRYTTAGLSRDLRDAGFEVELATYLFAALPPAIFLLRTLPSRLGLQREVDLDRERSRHGGGVAARVQRALFAAELRRLGRGRRLPFGASCLAVARALEG